MPGAWRLKTLMPRIALAMGLWWIISEGDAASWRVGGPAVLLAVLLSLRLQPVLQYRVSLPGLVLFGWFFLQRSLLAGVDVARRILASDPALQPGSLTLSLRLPNGAPRWLLAMTLSLLPGTVSCRLQGDKLMLHCLDLRCDNEQELRQAERKVAAVFGLELAEEERIPC